MSASNTATATVEVLSAEVRVLMVGSRQVTLSVYRQLDVCHPDAVEPFGRVSDPKDDSDCVNVVGKAQDGSLVRSWMRLMTRPVRGSVEIPERREGVERRVNVDRRDYSRGRIPREYIVALHGSESRSGTRRGFGRRCARGHPARSARETPRSTTPFAETRPAQRPKEEEGSKEEARRLSETGTGADASAPCLPSGSRREVLEELTRALSEPDAANLLNLVRQRGLRGMTHRDAAWLVERVAQAERSGLRYVGTDDGPIAAVAVALHDMIRKRRAWSRDVFQAFLRSAISVQLADDDAHFVGEDVGAIYEEDGANGE